MEKVVLIDGNNLLFRSFYATSYTGNIMRNSKGLATNALYGLINMLNKIIQEENPKYMMIAFDKGKTFRHEKYKNYKEGRQEVPNELKEQFPIAKQLVTAMGIKYYEIDNYEADDIIGTLSKLVDIDPNYYATIISSDKDLLQLISNQVEVKLLKQNDFIRMDRNVFKETYGVEPINMIDIKALMGDPSDNIPGVKGIGEKTAITLLKEYQTIENLYDNIDKIKGKTQEKLINDKESAFFSKEIATIYKDIDLDFEIKDLEFKNIYTKEYTDLLNELEFFSIIKKLGLCETKEEIQITYKEITNINEIDISKNYSIYAEILGTNYHKDKTIGISLSDGTNNYYIAEDNIINFKNLFENSNDKYTYDLKKLIIILDKYNIKINGKVIDLMIAAYLLNYNIKDDITYLSKIKGYDINFYEETFGKGTKLGLNNKNYVEDIVKKSIFIAKYKDDFIKEIDDEDEIYLFYNIEMPLVYVLADMEITGIKVDKNFLYQYGEQLDIEIKKEEQEIFNETNEEFNISSPKQLGDMLFNKMGIPYPKKIKDNSYSTSKDILDKLIDYPIIKNILRYRALTKLKSTYIDSLINEIRNDNRIHTIYTQTLTRTGRLSSISPNLQNIPMRTEEGRLIRKAFLPDDNSYLLSSDYSQIELRLFASLSKSENFIDAFKNDIDVHSQTASDIFNVDLKDVTKDMRRTAKAVNFGIIYGISGFGLSEDLGIDIQSAKTFIDKYLNTYPGIKDYMNSLIKKAYEDGYVKTIMNRKRVIEELKNKNYIIRSQGERMALNTPIQGSAADILKKAMVDVYNEFNKNNLKSKILLQVHDELVINVLDNEIDIVKEIVKNKMENVYQFDVPLKVEMDFGKDWYQAK